MSWMKPRTFAVLAACLTTAALLGSSLGIAVAGTRQSLSAGFNLVGGPLQADVPPDQFVGCIPSASWSAIYVWDGAAQSWQHYFNPTTVPSYVNSSGVGGISSIRKFAGVVLLMNQAVASPKLKDSSSETCS